MAIAITLFCQFTGGRLRSAQCPKGNRYKPYEAINTSYTIRKKLILYLLLEKNRAIACYTKALEFRNGTCFRRVTEEGYVTLLVALALYLQAATANQACKSSNLVKLKLIKLT